MKIIRTVREMQEIALSLRREGRRIGLVPSLGYMHEGHVSLMQIARKEADVVMVSIFVNPTQFGPGEDFARYPRDLQRDERLCSEAGVDYIFCPTVEEMYATNHSVNVVEGKLSSGLCGASRPGHFQGVATVVTKLFNICQPDVAVFGAKDGQQVRIIRRLVRDLNLPVRIVVGPTIREPDGLAMSSRNSMLTATERKNATCLRRALDIAEQLFRDGQRDATIIKQEMLALMASTPGARTDYVEIVDDETLEPVKRIERPCMVAVAVQFPSARLIDNTVLGGSLSHE